MISPSRLVREASNIITPLMASHDDIPRATMLSIAAWSARADLGGPTFIRFALAGCVDKKSIETPCPPSDSDILCHILDPSGFKCQVTQMRRMVRRRTWSTRKGQNMPDCVSAIVAALCTGKDPRHQPETDKIGFGFRFPRIWESVVNVEAEEYTYCSMNVRIRRVIPTSNPSDSNKKPSPKSTCNQPVNPSVDAPSSSSFVQPDVSQLRSASIIPKLPINGRYAP